MKRMFLAILGMLLLAAAAAEEPAMFNFGTMQPTTQLAIEPGTTTEAPLYFYNIYGNRVTHVRLVVTEAPRDWTVTFDPPADVQTFEVSGQTVESVENAFVEPTETVAQKPESVPAGMDYLKTGGIEGWIPTKVVKVVIKVPETAQLGNQKLRIEATANWFGTQGMVVSQQARSFDYDVTVALGEYSEKLLAQKTLVTQLSSFVSPFVKYIPYLSVALVVIMAFGLYLLNQKVEEARELTAVLRQMKERKKKK